MQEETQGAVAPESEVVAEGTIVETPAPAAEAAPEAIPPEAEKAEPIKVEPPKDPLSTKFAALSRKEKQLRERERSLQQQMNEMQQKLEQFKTQQAEVEKYKSIPDRLKKDPLSVFKESGLELSTLSDMLLNGGKPTESMERSELEQRVMAELEAVKRQLAEKEAKAQEQKYQEQLTNFVNELTGFVNNTPDYELIRAENAVELVYDVIEQHHAETGKILSNKEACDAVESHLLEQAKKILEREKVKKLYSANSSATPAPKPAQGKSTTLSNTQAAQVPVGQRNLSNEESLAEAAKLIRWQD